MKEFVKRTFEPGSYKISHSEMYTYITYHPIKGSTMVSSYMIPNGSGERVEIIDGVCSVIVDAVKHFEGFGFKNIHAIDEIEEGIIGIICDKLYPTENTPKILNVTIGYYSGEYGDSVEALQFEIEL